MICLSSWQSLGVINYKHPLNKFTSGRIARENTMHIHSEWTKQKRNSSQKQHTQEIYLDFRTWMHCTFLTEGILRLFIRGGEYIETLGAYTVRESC